MADKKRQDIVENLTTQQEEYQELSQPLKDKLTWFKDQKIGVIFHWGLYSQAGIVESWQLSKEDNWARKHGAWRDDLQTLREDYWNLECQFAPVKFEPNDWAQKAKAAGFKYMIFTTKHHDGFNMYDTKYSDYKITGAHCAFAKEKKADVLKYINTAFREAGIATGAYYSKADWHSPNYWVENSDPIGRYASYDPQKEPKRWQDFNNYVQNQLIEICENYGPIDILWLDGGWVNSQHNEFLDMDQLATKIRKIKPDTLIVDRTIGGEYENYVTPERKIPEIAPQKAWESNIPLANNWGYVPNDSYKSFEDILDSIVQIITLGGNVILGIGPKPDGTLPKPAELLMEQLGEWLNVFGEAVYGTRSVRFKNERKLQLTKKGNYYYLFFKQNQVGEKIDLSELVIENNDIINLENQQQIDVSEQNTMILPTTNFSYGVIKLKIIK